MQPETRTIAGQASWVAGNGDIELAVTRLGAHMAPVSFCRRSGPPVQPYYISPWQGENLGEMPAPVLGPLRGDFFCAPFGGNGEPWRGERHPPHGEPAGSAWDCAGLDRNGPVTTLTLTLEPRVRPGRITRRFAIVEGHDAVYTQAVLEGFSGPMCVGHHAILAVPEAEGSLRVATSPIRFGMTNPGVFADPAQREYQSFAVGARFASLRRVPLLFKKPAYADCTRFPARTGFTDLLGLVTRAGAGPAWTAATLAAEGYLWYALRDPAVLPTTLFWIANRGRHGSPWNGRNRCLGLEDVCACFADGLAASARPNVLSRRGIPTFLRLSRRTPACINYIQGVARVPAGFETVGRVRFLPGAAVFVSPRGQQVTVPVRHEFLRSGKLL